MKIKNLDLYVTGSNSHMLSSDILTEFRDRGDEIRVNPLTYSEFYSVYGGDKRHAWRDYYTYGGMPLAVTKSTHEEKSKYLKDLFTKTYLTDVLERHTIKNERFVLEDLLNIVSSSVGSLTNPTKLSNTFQSVKQVTVNPNTISRYLDYFIDAFIMYKAQRYDVIQHFIYLHITTFSSRLIKAPTSLNLTFLPSKSLMLGLFYVIISCCMKKRQDPPSKSILSPHTLSNKEICSLYTTGL